MMGKVCKYIFFKFYREMRVMGGGWDGKLYSCLQPLKMPPMRLQRRLIYLTKVIQRFSRIEFVLNWYIYIPVDTLAPISFVPSQFAMCLPEFIA